jgi:hypothetical protein
MIQAGGSGQAVLESRLPVLEAEPKACDPPCCLASSRSTSLPMPHCHTSRAACGGPGRGDGAGCSRWSCVLTPFARGQLEPVMHAVLLLLLVTAMYAILASQLFGDDCPEFFGRFSIALFTVASGQCAAVSHDVT